MSRKSSVVLLVAAILMVAVVSAALYLRAASIQAAPPALPAAIAVEDVVYQAPNLAAPAAARSAYVSEEALWRIFNEAADRHWGARGQAALHILNDRHEHRRGLPR